MGNLIDMTQWAKPSFRRAPIERDADILFFTGVRYFRMAEPAPPKATPKRRRSTKPLGTTPTARLEA